MGYIFIYNLPVLTVWKSYQTICQTVWRYSIY